MASFAVNYRDKPFSAAGNPTTCHVNFIEKSVLKQKQLDLRDQYSLNELVYSVCHLKGESALCWMMFPCIAVKKLRFDLREHCALY